MLTKNQFLVLRKQSESDFIGAPELNGYDSLSQSEIEHTIMDLQKLQLIQDNSLTEQGYSALAPYRVDNAIIMSAGMGTRCAPATYEIPKGLLKVKGIPLIERQICQLKECGINNIVVVVGYMKEKFKYLEKKYQVTLVFNAEYTTKNTHSSIYSARMYLSNSLIICSDNYYPKNPFHQYEYRSYYCASNLDEAPVTERTLIPDENDLVIDTVRPAQAGWVLCGHAYWSKDFSQNFIKILNDYYGKPHTDNLYWEMIWADHLTECPLWVKKYPSNNVQEFDSMKEIAEFDKEYLKSNNLHFMKNICNTLSCEEKDISDFATLKGGLTNKNFSFNCKGKKYTYRMPRELQHFLEDEFIIDRKKEAHAQRWVGKLGIDNTCVYIDSEHGWKITNFLKASTQYDPHNMQHVNNLARKIKRLHDAKIVIDSDFSCWNKSMQLLKYVKEKDSNLYQRMINIRSEIEKIQKDLETDQWPKCMCHNDIHGGNILVTETGLELIDWEFAGDADIGFDICKLFCHADPELNELDDYLYFYYGRKTTNEEKQHLIGCVIINFYFWCMWETVVYNNCSNVEFFRDKINNYMNKLSELKRGKNKKCN